MLAGWIPGQWMVQARCGSSPCALALAVADGWEGAHGRWQRQAEHLPANMKSPWTRFSPMRCGMTTPDAGDALKPDQLAPAAGADEILALHVVTIATARGNPLCCYGGGPTDRLGLIPPASEPGGCAGLGGRCPSTCDGAAEAQAKPEWESNPPAGDPSMPRFFYLLSGLGLLRFRSRLAGSRNG